MNPAPGLCSEIILQFALPGEFLSAVAPGRWHPCLHHVVVTVTAEGVVTIAAHALLETDGRRLVFAQLARLLRTLPRPHRPLSMAASLAAPSCAVRGERYAISLGARFAVARTDYAPTLFGDDFAPAFVPRGGT
jgi:hypothetical protein